jgi:hypothetical protein
MADDNSAVDRRTVLRSIGTAGAVVTGASSIGAARGVEDNRKAMFPHASEEAISRWEEYRDSTEAKRDAFNENIEPVAQVMREEGVEVPEFGDAVRTHSSPSELEGEDTAHVALIFNQGKNKKLSLHIYPHADRSFALLHEESGSTLLDPARDVTTLGCTVVSYCTDGQCLDGKDYVNKYEVCRIPGGGTETNLLGYDCGC